MIKFVARKCGGHVGVQVHLYAFQMAAGQLRLSTYAQNLPDEAKRRYREKIALINGLDPFSTCPGEKVQTVATSGRSKRFSCVLGPADEFYYNAAIQSPQITRSLQPVRMWMGQRCYHVQSVRKVCYDWTGTLLASFIGTFSCILHSTF